jgi:Ca2+-binding RTX toxin-like protein
MALGSLLFSAAIAPAASAQCPVSCAVAICGTSGNDVGAGAVQGTSGPDIICGLAGDDEIYGNGGNDRIFAGPGDDVVDGGSGSDWIDYSLSTTPVTVAFLFGGGGSDTEGLDLYTSIENVEGSAYADAIGGDHDSNELRGGGGSDEILGWNGADKLSGGDGDDALSAGGGADEIHGNLGNDYIEGGLGSDEIIGGDGDDIVTYKHASGGMSVNCSGATATGPDGTDSLAEIEGVEGSEHDDECLSASLVMRGLGGDDLIASLDPSAFVDYTYEPQVVVDLSTTPGTATTSEGTDTIYFIRNVIGSGDDDEITGSSQANYIVGGSGDDEMYGLGGNDTLLGFGGADFADGGSGTDTCVAPTKVNCE